MSAGGEVVVGLVVLVGLVGVVVQVLPGSVLVLGAILVWAVVTGGGVAWAAFAVAAVAIVAAAVVKYLLAGRHLVRAGVPTSSMVWGSVAGVVAFFAIPVVGLFIGFPLGVWLAELVRQRDARAAWTATRAALWATGITIVVELAGALVATAAWLVALTRT